MQSRQLKSQSAGMLPNVVLQPRAQSAAPVVRRPPPPPPAPARSKPAVPAYDSSSLVIPDSAVTGQAGTGEPLVAFRVVWEGSRRL